MRKIINSTYMTLDGVIEGPHLWPKLHAPTDERAAAIQIDLLKTCDAVLMGRRTYDVMASAWPTRSGDPLSERMNAIRKLVVSNSLKNPDWANTTVISGDAGHEIEKLKEEGGQDIVQYGFGSVSKLLMERGLLDELRLWLYPQTLANETSPTCSRRTQLRPNSISSAAQRSATASSSFDTSSLDKHAAPRFLAMESLRQLRGLDPGAACHQSLADSTREIRCRCGLGIGEPCSRGRSAPGG
jgi:dihydrofolate reductase